MASESEATTWPVTHVEAVKLLNWYQETLGAERSKVAELQRRLAASESISETRMKALKKYGQHTWRDCTGSYDSRCHCGLVEAIEVKHGE